MVLILNPIKTETVHVNISRKINEYFIIMKTEQKVTKKIQSTQFNFKIK